MALKLVFNPITGTFDQVDVAPSKNDIILTVLSATGFNGGLITESTFGVDPIDLGAI